MRDKLKDWLDQVSGGADGEAAEPAVPRASDRIAEAESALVALGYKPAEASRMVAAVNDEDVADSEDLIRRALKSAVSG